MNLTVIKSSTLVILVTTAEKLCWKRSRSITWNEKAHGELDMITASVCFKNNPWEEGLNFVSMAIQMWPIVYEGKF